MRLGHGGAEEAHDGDRGGDRGGAARRLHRRDRLGRARRARPLERRDPHGGRRPRPRLPALRHRQRRRRRLARRRASTRSACSRPGSWTSRRSRCSRPSRCCRGRATATSTAISRGSPARPAISAFRSTCAASRRRCAGPRAASWAPRASGSRSTRTAARRSRRRRCRSRPRARSRSALAARPVDPRSIWLFHKTTRREVYDEAAASRPDCDDVLLWNDRGELTESTVASVVVEIGGQRLTPPVSCGLLPGVERQVALAEGRAREGVVRISEPGAGPAAVAALVAARLARGAARRLRPRPRGYTREQDRNREL